MGTRAVRLITVLYRVLLPMLLLAGLLLSTGAQVVHAQGGTTEREARSFRTK